MAQSATVGLATMPSELLSYVFAESPRSSLKALAATCRRFRTATAPLRFPVLYISCHPLDLEAFNYIAADPVLLSGVRELVIDDTMLAPSRLGDLPRLCRGEEQGLVRVGGEDSFRKCYRLFKETCEAHHENRLARADIAALHAALPGMTALKSIALSNRTADDDPPTGAQSKHSSSPTVKAWRRLGAELRQRPPFPPRCDWRQGRTFPKKGEDAWIRDPDDDYRRLHHLAWPKVNMIAREARGLRVVMEAFSHPLAKCRVEAFRVDASHDLPMSKPGLPIRVLLRDASPFYQVFSTALCGLTALRKLHLVLGDNENIYRGRRRGRGIRYKELSEMLAMVPSSLEELVLETHDLPTIALLPKQHAFKGLKKLELHCGSLLPHMLSEFLRRHSATMEGVAVRYCHDNIDPFEEWPRDLSGRVIGKGRTWDHLVAEILELQRNGVTRLKHAELEHVVDTSTRSLESRNSTPEDSYFSDYYYSVKSWVMGRDEDLVPIHTGRGSKTFICRCSYQKLSMECHHLGAWVTTG
ncbi:hypothetical protein ACCO45_008626 [Purpureocillium lilacinum]|uniref:Uncharacterized protein n=1 Tax=Purpureocillium lilacinum TaxID=33203 RepID=A0ACC4DPJ6_PURLI